MAWRRLANELGFYFSEAHNERIKGVSRMDSLDILLEVGGLMHFSDEEKFAMADKKNDWYVAYISTMTSDEILSGALDFLHEVKAAGVKTAVCSASKNAGLILDRVGITSLFNAVIDGNKISKTKPDPEVFLLCAEELGVHPSQCIVFEDASAGIEAAIWAGMKCVGVGNPSILHRATLVIPDFKQIRYESIFNHPSMENY